MNQVTNSLMTIGLFLIALGVIAALINKFNIPGDIVVKKDNFTFYFPIASCLVLSILVTLLNLALKK